MCEKERLRKQAIAILEASVEMLNEAETKCLHRGNVSDSVFRQIERAKDENKDMMDNIEDYYFNPKRVISNKKYCKPSNERDLLLSLDDEPFRTNRFIVEFPDDFPIESFHVCRIIKPVFAFVDADNVKPIAQYNSMGVNTNVLTIILKNWNYGDAELLKIWKEFNKMGYKYIKVNDLLPDEKIGASEYYTNPFVTSIEFGDCDYSEDGLKTYRVTIAFKNFVSTEDIELD